jgi:hypothetical protein
LAVLWDIRVTPDARRQGVGSALFQTAETWAQVHGVGSSRSKLRIPTRGHADSIERQGCRLERVHRAAYPALPEEIQLLWYKVYRVDSQPVAQVAIADELTTKRIEIVAVEQCVQPRVERVARDPRPSASQRGYPQRCLLTFTSRVPHAWSVVRSDP